MTALLPCPFCQFRASEPQIAFSLGAKHWRLKCHRCDAMGPISTSPEEAIAAWNRRAPLSAHLDAERSDKPRADHKSIPHPTTTSKSAPSGSEPSAEVKP